MVLDDEYKYAVDDLGRPLILFDIKEDPLEQHNLVGRHGAFEEKMQRKLLQFYLRTQYTQHVRGARRK
jgi:hypothetical protein